MSTGLQAASALGLPGSRQSVGVEVQGNAYSVLLPYSVCAPCSATQIFTTVHDGQAQVIYQSLTACTLPPCTSFAHISLVCDVVGSSAEPVVVTILSCIAAHPVVLSGPPACSSST